MECDSFLQHAHVSEYCNSLEFTFLERVTTSWGNMFFVSSEEKVAGAIKCCEQDKNNLVRLGY